MPISPSQASRLIASAAVICLLLPGVSRSAEEAGSSGLRNNFNNS